MNIRNKFIIGFFFLFARIYSQSMCGVGFTPKTHDAPGYTAALDTIAANYDFTQLFFTCKWAQLTATPFDTAYKDPVMQWLVNEIHNRGTKLLACFEIFNSENRSKLNLPQGYSGSDTIFTSTVLKQAYLNELLYMVKRYQPEFVALAIEADEYLNHIGTAERDSMLAAVSAVRDSIKNFNPSIKTFVYFQFENVLYNNHWNLIKPFADSSDYFAFSSYPSVFGIYGSGLSLNYYDTIASIWGNAKPIAFPEFGEPSDTSVIFPNASPQNQQNFISRFFSSVSDLNTSLISWVYLHDIDLSAAFPSNPSVAKYFGSLGLRHDTTGTAKLAFPYFNCQLLSVNNIEKSASQIKIYPNPSSQGETYLSIESTTQNRMINIYDMLGVRVKKITIPPGTTTVDLQTTNMLNGIYIVEVIEDNVLTNTGRFIVTNR